MHYVIADSSIHIKDDIPQIAVLSLRVVEVDIETSVVPEATLVTYKNTALIAKRRIVLPVSI